jgi:hypothetical protein
MLNEDLALAKELLANTPNLSNSDLDLKAFLAYYLQSQFEGLALGGSMGLYFQGIQFDEDRTAKMDIDLVCGYVEAPEVLMEKITLVLNRLDYEITSQSSALDFAAFVRSPLIGGPKIEIALCCVESEYRPIEAFYKGRRLVLNHYEAIAKAKERYIKYCKPETFLKHKKDLDFINSLNLK